MSRKKEFERVPYNEHPFDAECLGCGRTLRSRLDTIYADYGGCPYRAYYCEECKTKEEQP